MATDQEPDDDAAVVIGDVRVEVASERRGSYSRMETVNTLNVTRTALKAQLGVADRRYVRPARHLARALVTVFVLLVIAMIVMCFMPLGWQERVAAFIALGGAAAMLASVFKGAVLKMLGGGQG